MTLLAVYETPSERKQRRRNKLEVGSPGGAFAMHFDKPAAPAFLLHFYDQLYGPVFGTLYQRPEGESEQDPRQKVFPATPPANITSSGDQDNPSPSQSRRLSPRHLDLGQTTHS
jgi:hypothetical protein